MRNVETTVWNTTLGFIDSGISSLIYFKNVNVLTIDVLLHKLYTLSNGNLIDGFEKKENQFLNVFFWLDDSKRTQHLSPTYSATVVKMKYF